MEKETNKKKKKLKSWIFSKSIKTTRSSSFPLPLPLSNHLQSLQSFSNRLQTFSNRLQNLSTQKKPKKPKKPTPKQANKKEQ